MNKLYAVGIGPGGSDRMTAEAEHVLAECDVIIGYHVYVDLIKDDYPDKEFLTTPMKQESKRCRMALDKAAMGSTTAMVCSGDAGVYGMAGLLYELGQDYPDVEIIVVPGVTAALSGAAVLGAPLIHDFAVISLSDLLTPWEKIKRRLKAAAMADFAVCLYNPSSKKRHDYLARACDYMLEYKRPETVCGLVRNIGRDGQEYRILTLAELKNTEVDMFTTVFIGNEQTKQIGDKMVTPRGYQDEQEKMAEGETETETVLPLPLSEGNLPDTAFIRGKVPMTKEEIRFISIAKLNLKEGSVLYDIGAGTGSVSVEAALHRQKIRVYAIEKKPEAIELIRQNKQKFNAGQITVVCGTAPEALDGLEKPTHVFIGGSSGNLREILLKVKAANPLVRVVINAVTLETLNEVLLAEKEGVLAELEIVQAGITKVRNTAGYHMLDGQNPVYIISEKRPEEEMQ